MRAQRTRNTYGSHGVLEILGIAPPSFTSPPTEPPWIRTSRNNSTAGCALRVHASVVFLQQNNQLREPLDTCSYVNTYFIHGFMWLGSGMCHISSLRHTNKASEQV